MNQPSQDSSVLFRWLGVAGIELSYAGQFLLIDPYFTRISLWNQFFGRLYPDVELSRRYAPRADHILVTHAHNDHLLDVPTIASQTGAVVYGSPNTCQLCRAQGLHEPQVCLFEPGQSLRLGPFQVDVTLSKHMPVPIFTPGRLPARLEPPLKALDYRMDTNYCYHILVNGLHISTDPGIIPLVPPEIDVLFVLPYRKLAYYRSLFKDSRVKWIIPNHWDDFWRPLNKPILPQRTPPGMAWPPLARLNLKAWQRAIEQFAPGAEVLLPEIFQEYQLLER